MIPSFLITFRETFEATLVLGIMLGYLTKTRNDPYKKYVYGGALGGIAVSILTAMAFNYFAAGFSGQNEQIFEGSTMLIAAFLVTTMIVWMAGQRHFSDKIKEHIRKSIDIKYGTGIALFSLFAVYREGVEIILFLEATAFSAASSDAFGASAGIFGAMALGYLFFKAVVKLNLAQFFKITGALLILVAAGLASHGVHEFQEAGVLPYFASEAWNTAAILNDKTEIGAIIRSVFGYNDNPTHLEAGSYFAYLALAGFAWAKIGANKIRKTSGEAEAN